MFEQREYLTVSQVVEQTTHTYREIETVCDSPVDMVIDEIVKRANGYSERIPTTSRGFAMAVSSIARETLTAQAISGIILEFIREEILTIQKQVLRATISLIRESPDPHMTCDVLSLVSGMSSEKEATIARRFNVERATISKRAIILKKKLGIQSSNMRTNTVCNTYRDRQIGVVMQARAKLKAIL